MEKYAGVAEESLRLSMKERVEENETVGTRVRGGGRAKKGLRGRVRVREKEKGEWSLLIPPHLASIRMWGPLK